MQEDEELDGYARMLEKERYARLSRRKWTTNALTAKLNDLEKEAHDYHALTRPIEYVTFDNAGGAATLTYELSFASLRAVLERASEFALERSRMRGTK